MNRHFWVLFHRYAGLFMAFFLIIIGLTGSIIVFNQELTDWLNPPPKVVPQATPMLDAYALRERAQALVPHGRFNSLNLHIKPDEPYTVWMEPRIDPVTDKPYELDLDVLMLDPYTGVELKRDKYGQDIFPITKKNVMPLINRLHYQMALPGMTGTWLFGIVALVWTIDCFVSGYLTFPVTVRRRENGPAQSGAQPRKFWLFRWWNPAWLVKWSGSTYRINFDLHRAGGLWVWILLLAIAWSSVGFNLGEQIYQPVMKAAFNMRNPYGDVPNLDKPRAEPTLNWKDAYTIAQGLMAVQAKLNGFTVQREEGLQYVADKGVFIYSVRSNRDLMDKWGGTYLVFDGNSGGFVGLSVPTGQNAGGTINSWIFALHTAAIWGLPFKIFITTVGLLIVMLSVTGVYIWLKKRRARLSTLRPQA